MSLDDMMSEKAPTLCDKCSDVLQGTEPDPVVGWQMLVFTCETCHWDFCEHLQSPAHLVCVDCHRPSGKTLDGK